jgi:hypothetical protein
MQIGGKFTWEWAKQIPIWDCPMYDDLKTLTLFYVNQL